MEEIGELIEKICKHSGLSDSEVKKKIEEKQDELSGLVSEEGAAYIVARELGLSLIKETKRQLKIKNLVSGLRSVDLVARITEISDVREFEKNGRKGRVANLVLGDETGFVRLSLWNDEIGLIKDEGLSPGQVIRISGAYTKMDNRGNPELRIGRGRIEKVEEKVDIPETEEMKKEFGSAKREVIANLKEGGFYELRAAMVQIFRRNPFYEVCPECGTRLSQETSENKEDGTEVTKWVCRKHGAVKPEYQMVVSGVIDDDSGNIRAVFFREIAERLFGKKIEELREMLEKEKDPGKIYEQADCLGKEFIIRGRVKKNDLTGSLEFVANDIEEIDVEKEVENLMKEVGSSSGIKESEV